MPKRPRSHELEDISRNRLHGIFEGIGWTAEDIAKDYGEDLLVRIFEHGTATPLKFYVQAKATDNIARYLNKSSDALNIRLDRDHLDQWNSFREPVILTVWDSRSENTYWTCVQNALKKSACETKPKKNRTTSISIPCGNLLDAEGLRRIKAITQTWLKRLAREKQGVEVLKQFMEARFGVNVEYSPERGIVILEGPRKRGEVVLFGKVASELIEVAKKLKKSPQQAFHTAIERFSNDLDKHKKTGKYPVMNPSTRKVENKKMTAKELSCYLQAELERLEDEAEG